MSALVLPLRPDRWGQACPCKPTITHLNSQGQHVYHHLPLLLVLLLLLYDVWKYRLADIRIFLRLKHSLLSALPVTPCKRWCRTAYRKVSSGAKTCSHFWATHRGFKVISFPRDSGDGLEAASLKSWLKLVMQRHSHGGFSKLGEPFFGGAP